MRVSIAVFLVLLALPALATGPDPAAVPPTDPSVLQGSLPNGLRYFVRANPKPEKRIELRLALRAGSVHEEESERGLAHFNEHMSFNGSKNFTSGEVVTYLESIGARFGADSNAYTSYEETVYRLQVPTDREGALDRCMLILADWAGRATLSTDEIDKERGVVLDEMRRGKGARKRIRDKQNEVLFQGSRYAERQPIGLESVLQSASPDTVRGFYHRWYRPDLMAVVAVGDLDPKAMEEMIRRFFGEIPKPSAPIERPRYPVPAHDATLVSVESDKELTSSSVTIFWKREPGPEKTVGDIRRDMVEGLASSLLTRRLSERALQPDPPFLGAGAGGGRYLETLQVFTLMARAKDGEVPRASGALMEELARARKFGFVAEELERAKTMMLQMTETRFKERDQRRSDERVGEIVGSFLNDTPLTSDEYDYELTRELVPGITLPEVNAALLLISGTKSRVVLVQVPKKEGLAVPTEEEIRKAIEPPDGFQVTAYVDDLKGKTLVATPPAPGAIVSRRPVPEVGIEEWTLSNGLRVVVKTTDFRNDQILMAAYALGGAADFPAEDFLAAMRADRLAEESGVGGFTLTQLRKLLAGSGSIADASVGVSRFGRSWNGSCRPSDLETMLQLVWLRFTKPDFREEAFRKIVDQEVQALQNQLLSPGGVFQRAVEETATFGNPLFGTPEVKEVQALKKDDLERLYRKMFADASEWTVFLVGNVDREAHAPLVERYLGSLPSTSKEPRTAADLSFERVRIRFPSGRTWREVRKGIEDQSQTAFLISAPAGLDPQVEYDIRKAADLLRIRLRERLREERGDTYGVGVGYSNLQPYKDYGRITVSFSSSPDTRGSMMQDVLRYIRTLREVPPTEDEVRKIRLMDLNSLDESEKENGWWLGQLQSAYFLGRGPLSILDIRKRIDGLTADSIEKAAKKWFDLGTTAEVYLVPEGWEPPAAAPAGK